LRGEDETDAVSQDVATVVRSKIDDLIASGLPATLMEAVQETLIARADRTFLWVSLILNLLEERVEAGASRRELDEILNTRDIFDIYARLLESRSKSPRARKMLSIILAATRALTLDEISVALVVPPTHETLLYRSRDAAPLEPKVLALKDMEYDIVFPYENHIKSLCGHFVRIIQGRVYLVHETAREFLLASSSEAQHKMREGNGITPSQAPEEQSGLDFQHSFNLVQAKAMLLDICVTYLYCLAQGTEASSQTTTAAGSFLSYAARSWMVHFYQVKNKLQPRDFWYFQALCHPLFPSFRAWIEECWEPKWPERPANASYEEMQDFYIRFFNIDSPSPPDYEEHGDIGLAKENDDDDSDSDSGATAYQGTSVSIGVNRGGIPVQITQQITGPTIVSKGLAHLRRPSITNALGSNPASMVNHQFSLRVDGSTGMVSLDLASSRKVGEMDQSGQP
jgi:hypothetical protein